MKDFINKIHIKISRIISYYEIKVIISFLLLILSGAVLLTLSPSASPSHNISFLNALFTSTSAVCVTGLTVLDTGHDFSFFGQFVILILMQLGGLGIMTLSNWAYLSLKHKVSLKSLYSIEESYGDIINVSPITLLKWIVFATLGIEFFGALILFIRWSFEFPVDKAIWLAIFHSVAAFCNAGFSLFTNSLENYAGDWVINLVIIILIISGGLGFVVFAELITKFQKKDKKTKTKWSLHSYVVVKTSLILIISGWIIIFISEYSNTLSHLDWPAKILGPLFTSVTPRTAGFNTLATGQLNSFTLIFIMIFMVIGASPGSTGGGVKTTTAAILLLLLRSIIKNREQVAIKNKALPKELVQKALATVVLYCLVIIIAVIAFQITESGLIYSLSNRTMVLDHVFEIASALGTVGLSTGITARLTPYSQIILIFLMFVGRLGPLFLATSIIGRKKQYNYTLPEEKIMIG